MRLLSLLPIRRRGGFPIVPGSVPVLGHLPILMRYGLEVLRYAWESLGPVFWIRHGPRDWILVTAGTEGYDLLRSKSVDSANMGELLLLNGTMLALDGVAHQHVRSAMGPAFAPRGLSHSGAGAMMAHTVAAHLGRWVEQRRLPVLAGTQSLTLEIIFRLVGIEVEDLPLWHRHYRDYLLSAFDIRIRLPGFPHDRADRARRWLDQRFRALIAERRRAPRADFLSALVAARDEGGDVLSDDELASNLRLLCLAGHETTASVLARLFIALARDAALWDALCEEVQKGPEPRIPVSASEARAYPLAEALFREVLRLHPPTAIVGRQTHAAILLYGRQVPPETKIDVSLPLLGRDPALFPDPERFDPGRWLGRAGQPTPLELAPFGGGAHFCLGYNMAWLEGVQFLVGLVHALRPSGRRPCVPEGPLPRGLAFPLSRPSARIQATFA